jgi:hypothetical protein
MEPVVECEESEDPEEAEESEEAAESEECEIKTMTMESILTHSGTGSEFEECKCECECETEMDIINKWKTSARDNMLPLIAMIQRLYFFSDCRKSTLRTYTSSKEDISSYIGKIKRRPELQIDASDIDICNHPQIFDMHRRLRTMIGMFRVNDFMVRVEHAFDNAQIISEHFVVSQIMKHENDPTVGGIDPVHHIVLPTFVQLNNLLKIPASKRTLFHHISYSIQPIVFHSQTLDTWFKTAIVSPTTEQIMQLCIKMAEALTYLHSCDIVHGDIKPGNTLIQTNHEYADSSSGSSSSSSSSSGSGSGSGSSDSDNSEHESQTTRAQTQTTQPHAPSLSLYLIDFGMSGSPGQSDGTGGTKPFCAPETGNGFNPKIDVEAYTWTKNQKCHDVWSFALMFFTFIVLRKSTAYTKDYPYDFFDVGRKGHINPLYFEKINDSPTRDLFRSALCPAEERVTAAKFLADIRCIVTGVGADDVGADDVGSGDN